MNLHWLAALVMNCINVIRQGLVASRLNGKLTATEFMAAYSACWDEKQPIPAELGRMIRRDHRISHLCFVGLLHRAATLLQARYDDPRKALQLYKTLIESLIKVTRPFQSSTVRFELDLRQAAKDAWDCKKRLAASNTLLQRLPLDVVLLIIEQMFTT